MNWGSKVGIPYNKFTYISPPRAESAIPPNLLKAYQRTNWIAQVKKNGTNSVIFVSPDKEVTAMGRHNNEHKQWQFTPESSAIFKTLPGRGWYVINAELMHSKVAGIRDINYIHDVLVEDGEYLLGSTYAQRYSRLLMLFLHKKPSGPISHFILDDHTWLARNHEGSFIDLFNSLDAPEDEGIVLKNMQGHLSPKNNNGWTVKCRRSHKNFGF
jgi:hypothetical protein